MINEEIVVLNVPPVCVTFPVLLTVITPAVAALIVPLFNVIVPFTIMVPPLPNPTVAPLTVRVPFRVVAAVRIVIEPLLAVILPVFVIVLAAPRVTVPPLIVTAPLMLVLVALVILKLLLDGNVKLPDISIAAPSVNANDKLLAVCKELPDWMVNPVPAVNVVLPLDCRMAAVLLEKVIEPIV